MSADTCSPVTFHFTVERASEGNCADTAMAADSAVMPESNIFLNVFFTAKALLNICNYLPEASGYLAKATDLVSLMTVIFTCPG